MKHSFRIVVGLIIIWLGIKSLKQIFGGYRLGLFHQFQYIPFFLLIIFTIAVLLLDTTYYKLDNKIYQYTISFIGLALCAIVTFKIIQHNSIDSSKTILKVSKKVNGTSVMTFDFKSNNHFRLTEYNKSEQTVYYGLYSKTKDTLKIFGSNYNDSKKLPSTGLIKNETVYWDNFDTMLVDKE